ncbi:hypothetical protein PENSPDRAFT_607783 [Peniophora sp. CONT]|nr:hypothetical protein PENSPDRAFT_607783 [Peniophora sp. CONT]
MDEYLRKDLHVPGEQIVNLRNKFATRSAIIREIYALAKNPSIRKDDPILIFYAGHGTSAQTPDGWETGREKISALVPYDTYGVDEHGPILPIPDRTIGGLLHEIAEGVSGEGKGNNITVIFDCCHSGSGTRDTDYPPMCLERGFEMDENVSIPSSLDENIWSNLPEDRALSVVSGFAMYGTRSHVLLAACLEGEKAHEENHRGKFTGALLHTLRQVETHKLTYKDLMERITEKMKDQTPQCEGHYIDRTLFNALVPSTPRTIFTVSQKGEEYTLNAGSAHGITSGAQFAIYPSHDFESQDIPLATMIADTVGAFSTGLFFVADGVEDLPTPCFALQTLVGKANALRLYMPQSANAGSVLRDLKAELDDVDYPVVLREDETQTDLSVYEHVGRVEYFINDPLIKSFGLQKLFNTTGAETRYIHPILRSATHFFWHFNRSPDVSALRDSLHVQVHVLQRDDEAELDLYLRPPYRTHGENLNRDGIVDVVADDVTAYGVTVESDFTVPLHVWAFYFDCSDLSISDYYQPPAFGVRGEAPLPANGKLTIGYGAGGGQPFKYYLRPDQDLDVGFIKLFVSTRPVDLSSVVQRSPFGTEDGMERGSRETAPPLVEDTWDTITIAVVQRKHPLDLSPPVT